MRKQKFSSAKACGARKDLIEQFATDFAASVDYRPGADLKGIVARLGGRISYKGFADIGDTSDASVFVFGHKDFEIYLPDYTSAERDRFSIAHELGHYVLHYPLVKKPMTAARYGSTRVEWEANWFAAGFLMPATEFKKQFKRTGGSLDDVARFFKVSNAAASARAKALGLIDP